MPKLPRPSLFAELLTRLTEARRFIAACGGPSAKRLTAKIRATLRRAREEVRRG